MFLGERRELVERLILADGPEEREAALAALLPLQRADFIGILAAMDGLPVTIRLLDPPLHEFLPPLAELTARVARAEALGADPGRRRHPARRRSAGCTRRTRCSGCAACGSAWWSRGCSPCRSGRSPRRRPQRIRAGGDPRPEIMVPLVGAVRELAAVREEAERVLAEVDRRAGDPDRHDDRGAAGGADRRARSPPRRASSPSAPTTSPRPPGRSPATTWRARSSPPTWSAGSSRCRRSRPSTPEGSAG